MCTNLSPRETVRFLNCFFKKRKETKTMPDNCYTVNRLDSLITIRECSTLSGGLYAEYLPGKGLNLFRIPGENKKKSTFYLN